MTKSERFQIFIGRLQAAPNAGSKDAALRLITSTLNQVENEFSGVACEPTRWMADGRMYPPQEDNARQYNADLTEWRSVGHRTRIASNGAFEIVRLSDGFAEISKQGSEGKAVEC